MLTIRPERAGDHEQVFHVVETAFGRPDEARLVNALRQSPSFMTELSLVAVEGHSVLGHIFLSRVLVRSGAATHHALALAPLAVLPERQRSGIGSSLVRKGLAESRRLGYGAVIVVGQPEYYPRFGFVHGEPLDSRPPFPVSPGAFMVLELRPNGLSGVRGEVEYPPEFAGL